MLTMSQHLGATSSMLHFSQYKESFTKKYSYHLSAPLLPEFSSSPFMQGLCNQNHTMLRLNYFIVLY